MRRKERAGALPPPPPKNNGRGQRGTGGSCLGYLLHVSLRTVRYGTLSPFFLSFFSFFGWSVGFGLWGATVINVANGLGFQMVC